MRAKALLYVSGFRYTLIQRDLYVGFVNWNWDDALRLHRLAD